MKTAVRFTTITSPNGDEFFANALGRLTAEGWTIENSGATSGATGAITFWAIMKKVTSEPTTF